MNIVEKLRNCPRGTKLYSPIFGEVELICTNNSRTYPIQVECHDGYGKYMYFTSEGKYYETHPGGECVLFPSRDNRDWSTFKAPKKEYNFKPFDKVLVRDYDDQCWECNFFSRINGSYFCCTYGTWTYCIPYEGNEHLVGTTKNPN